MIVVEGTHPDSAVLRLDETASRSSVYYVKLSVNGVIASTVRIFRKYSLNGVEQEITGAQPVYDEFNNLVRMTNIIKNDTSTIVYLTYEYEPQTYWENIKQVWSIRLAKDTEDYNENDAKLTELNNAITEAENKLKTALKQKAVEDKYFADLMGPTIREGYWQPENYSDPGDSYISSYYLNQKNFHSMFDNVH